MLGKLLLGLTATLAVILPPVLYADQTLPLRWLYGLLAEALALSLLVSAVPLFRTAFTRTLPITAHDPAPTPTEVHDKFTLPFPLRPPGSEKRLAAVFRVAITQPAGLPTTPAFSPDTVLVSVPDKADLLRFRRELRLAPAAHFFCSLNELYRQLPPSPSREISRYLICGDRFFLTDMHENLVRLGVSRTSITCEELKSAPELPFGHPSAPIAAMSPLYQTYVNA